MAKNLFLRLKTNEPVSVPMVYYHSIADTKDDWPFRHLSCPVSIFESHLKALRFADFHTISLQNLYGYMAEGKPIPPRSVVLTFDDGYLDNWVFAFPLLKKYGFIGTIFVNPDFVDPSESIRPNLEDVWNGRISPQSLPTDGFLSWQEMRVMERSGCIDIQSHGLTHTWYFSSAKIVDFHHPGDSYPWLAWNARPERKHLWMTEDQHAFVAWGTPVFEYEKSLATRRYFPDDGLVNAVTDHVKLHGEEAFFETDDWRQELEQVVINYRKLHNNDGYLESEAEYRARLHQELSGSKQLIEKQLDKSVEFLCWPGGGYTDVSVEISRQVGYLSSEDSSRGRGIKKNRYSSDPTRWFRIYPPWFQWNEKKYEYKGGLYFICLLNTARGSYLAAVLYKALRLPFKLSQWTSRFRRSISSV